VPLSIPRLVELHAIAEQSWLDHHCYPSRDPTLTVIERAQAVKLCLDVEREGMGRTSAHTREARRTRRTLHAQ
jgi:hypothetical protein